MAKKAFALRLDDKMLSALQRWAEDEFRSVNGQIEYLLHDALRKAGRLPAKQSDDTNAANPADEQAE
ncbi:Arc family DNA-binding protein [Arsukibacterium sp.]|uniref:Arc family DNA-binding protein n=1 Tax=Arsukibacterium sp. TaxID=1977258 RepID=UPI001BD66C62